MSKLEKEAEWIRPENLQSQQSSEKSKPLDAVDNRSDFGSYRLLLAGDNASLIEQHNCIGDKATIYAKILSQVMSLPKENFTLADVGCGAGFVAGAIQEQFPKAQIDGYDISEDAVAYGKLHYPKVQFFAQAIHETKPMDRQYDVIHAKEFYPFTRTNSLECHLNYIQSLMDSTTENGLLVIASAQISMCVLNNLEPIQERFRDRYTFQIFNQPSNFAFRLIPSVPVANLISKGVNGLLRRRESKLVLIRKKRS